LTEVLQNPVQLLPVAVAFVLSVVLTPVVRTVARHRNLVARPSSDRWHKQPTALFGGIALFQSVVTVSLIWGPQTLNFLSIVAGSSLLFVVGLIDDLISAKPYQKLIAQILAASLVIAGGLVLPWTPSAPINMAITLFWLVGITNAVNLLDNMDGLAAGISAIAGTFVSINLALNGQLAEAVMVAAFVAAVLGFLIYNSNPASIFMGDCGSMFLGFFLSGAALISLHGGRTQSILPVLAVPVLVLLIPIFDTVLVTIVRRTSGRAVSQGGRDHASHRLVALGLSERRTVVLLYTLAALAGCLGLAVRNLPQETSVAVLAGFTIGLTILGIYLGQVAVYDATEVASAQQKPVVSFLIDLSYKRRVFEVLLDGVLVLLSWYIAWVVLFGPIALTGSWNAFISIAPLLLAVKLPTLLIMGVYRGLWRYIGLDSLVTFAKASVVSSVVFAIAILFVYRFLGFSRGVLILDGVLLFLLLTSSRLGFRLLRRVLPGGADAIASNPARRVLIYGAGDGGELLLRELRNNSSLGCKPVGFLDDDPLKEKKVIHGLKVLGGNNSFQEVCERHNVDEVLISSLRISNSRVTEIAELCHRTGIPVRRMRFQLEPVEVIEPQQLQPVAAGVSDANDVLKRDENGSPGRLL